VAVPRPDGESFNKLLVSAGTAIVGVGIGAPWLMMRDTSLVTIPKADIDKLTPAAQQVIAARQSFLRQIQGLSWAFMVVGCFAGGALIMWGALRLRKRQGVDDAMLQNQLDEQNQRLAIGEQTSAEVDERREAEVDERLSMEHPTSSPEIPLDPDGARPTVPLRVGVDRQQFLDRLREVEHKALGRIEQAGADAIEVVREPKIESRERGYSYRPDALVRMLSSRPGWTVLVEVKLMGTSLRKSLRNRSEPLASALFHLADAFSDGVSGWLVLVIDDVDTEIEVHDLEWTLDQSRRLETNRLQIDVVRHSELDSWLPRIPGLC
jgi:hypothetical protein